MSQTAFIAYYRDFKKDVQVCSGANMGKNVILERSESESANSCAGLSADFFLFFTFRLVEGGLKGLEPVLPQKW